MPEKQTPSVIATATVEKFVNRFGNAARNVAEDLKGDYDPDEFASVLHGYADSALTQIAQEAVNEAFRAGRAEGLAEVEPEIARAGMEATWRRSSVMSPTSCESCVSLDGSEIDGEDDDLSDECDGGPLCQCVPYLDLDEAA